MSPSRDQKTKKKKTDPETISPDQAGTPPEAPGETGRRLRFAPTQLIGVPLIAIPAVLALLGVFGESRETARAAGPGLAAEISYASRFRYKTLDRIEVWVTNRSATVADSVTVAIDTSYLNRFSNVTFIPSADAAYETAVTDLGPGETRLVAVEVQAEQYWRHKGGVRVTSAGGDTLRLPLSTFVWP